MARIGSIFFGSSGRFGTEPVVWIIRSMIMTLDWYYLNYYMQALIYLIMITGGYHKGGLSGNYRNSVSILQLVKLFLPCYCQRLICSFNQILLRHHTSISSEILFA